MRRVYPIVMTQGEKYVVVFIPDFNINTQGVDFTEAIEMARDALGIMGVDMIDDGEELPNASKIKEIKAEEGSILSLVDVDFNEYRRKNDLKAVKKNCTIPSWLNYEAEKAGINFSAILQSALKAELKISDR